MSRWWVSLHFIFTNRMEQRPFWDADIRRASQYIARHLYKPKVHCRVQQSPPMDLKAWWTRTSLWHPVFLTFILILLFHPYLRLQRSALHSKFPTKLPTHVSPRICLLRISPTYCSLMLSPKQNSVNCTNY